MNIKWGSLILFFSMMFCCLSADAQWVNQPISLTEGWNAIYLYAQPEPADCASVFNGWPIQSVSLYRLDVGDGRFSDNPAESINPEPEYWVWNSETPAASSLERISGDATYLIYATADYDGIIWGHPVVPRDRWLPSDEAINLSGFCVGTNTADFSSWFDGSGLDVERVFQVGGTGVHPTRFLIGGFTGGLRGTISPGEAYFVQCNNASTYTGPMRISPSGSGGIDFGSSLNSRDLLIRNESGTNLTVTINYQPSEQPPNTTPLNTVTLQIFDPDQGWLEMDRSFEKVLLADEVWTIRFALDRSIMSSDFVYGSLIECTDSRGGMVHVPVSATFASDVNHNARWPAGLWVGEAILNEVSYVDSSISNNVPAGGVLKYRLILHVDMDDNVCLLQRVLLSNIETEDDEWIQKIYLDESIVPNDAQTIRVSSTAFSLKNDMGYSASGKFGEELIFNYTIRHDDPSNPFRHPYHPAHDGLRNDFETELPSGDELQNYIGEIKPETFSIGNTVSLVWSGNEAEGSALWNPIEQVSGTYTHTLHGLRREGPVQMNGVFRLKRISKVGVLTTE